MQISKALALVVVACLASGCSGSNPVLTPQPRSVVNPTANPTGNPTTKPTTKPTTAPSATPLPTATPTVGPGGLSVAQVDAALQNTKTYYATLPHTNVVADIQAVATQMVASGQYTSAVISPGGITGTLPDGSTALIFADEPEDLDPGSPSAMARRAARRAAAPPARMAKHGPVAHEFAFLYNDTDPDFSPNYDQDWVNAFQNVPFQSTTAATTQYAVDAAPVSLASIVGLGAFPIDYLNITTHGMVATLSMGSNATKRFYMLSSTKYDLTTRTTYPADYAAGNIAYGLFLSTDSTTVNTNVGLMAFSPEFLANHLTFNPGAVVNFATCFSQNPLVASSVAATLQNAHVGRYFGWTKAVGITDDYQSMAFMFDRLVGEQPASASMTSGLNEYAAQRVPPQRPFNLTDVHNVMGSEMRSNVIEAAKNQTYTESDVGFAPNASQPPEADGTLARQVMTDFGYEGLTTAPIIYGFPSIANISIAETASSGTMTIAGEFPSATGTVQIVDSSGTTQLTVNSWGLTSITATIPAGGNGSSGLVTVVSSTGIASNAVPLTKWSGMLTYTESDEIPDLDGTSGSGGGSLSTQFDIDFRADVHPYAPSVDVSPSPQPFVFDYTEGDSTAQLTSYTGSYTSTEKTPHTATWSLASPAPILNAALPPLQLNTFEIRQWANQPAPCNYGTLTVPAAGSGLNPNVFCPLVGFLADPAQIICTDDDGGALCNDNGDAGLVAYSGPFDAMGLLSLTLDPSTYAISVAATTSSFTSEQFYDSDRPATASMTGSISGPSYAPSGATPALRTRYPLPKSVHRKSLGQIIPDAAAYAARYRMRVRHKPL